MAYKTNEREVNHMTTCKKCGKQFNIKEAKTGEAVGSYYCPYCLSDIDNYYNEARKQKS